MKRIITCSAVAVLSVVSAFGEAYDPAKHGNPIVVTSGTVEIDGNGAVIDGKGAARCATLGPNVTLRNFTLKNGFADWGGGVRGGTLVNCRIENCKADLGGGAYGSALSGCTVVGCVANESGAALGDCTAVESTITGNRHVASAAKVAVHGGIVFGSTLTRCTVTDNTVGLGDQAPAFGGVGEDVTIVNCTVRDNVVSAGDGICYGQRFASSAVNGTAVAFDDNLSEALVMTDSGMQPDEEDKPGQNEPGPDEPEIDYGVLNTTNENWFSATCADSAGNACLLTVTTAKQKVKGGVATATFKATVTVNGKTYSYAGGKIVDGKVAVLPTCRKKGAPELDGLAFGSETVRGTLDGVALEGDRITSAPTVSGWEGDKEGMVGMTFSAKVLASDAAVKFSASGLPSGLKINATTGEIAGVPKSAKTATVKVTVKSTLNTKWKTAYTQTVVIRGLPAWAVGTYAGGGDGGLLQTLKIAKTGKVTGKWLEAGKKWTVSATGFDAFDYNSEIGSLTLSLKSGGETKTAGAVLAEEGLAGELFEATCNDWTAEPWKGLSKKMAKQKLSVGDGEGNVMDLAFAAKGKVTAKVTMANGYSAKGTAVLCQMDDRSTLARVYVYLPPKAGVLPEGYLGIVDVLFGEDGTPTGR